VSHPDRSGALGSAVSFRDLTLGYGRRPAVHHLDGAVQRGELLALVGPNGAGKSTLLKGIVGQSRVLGGSVDLHGRKVRDVAYLPQRAEIDQDFPIGVQDFVATGAWRRLGAWRREDSAENRRVERALDAVALRGFETRPLATLSGGQLQRALFARTIVQDTELILLDEPFAAIDERTTSDLLAIIASWRGEGRTVIAALHDLAHVRSAFTHALVLAREPIAWGTVAAVLTPANLDRSRRLVEAWSAARDVCGHSEGGSAGEPDREGAKRRAGRL